MTQPERLTAIAPGTPMWKAVPPRLVGPYLTALDMAGVSVTLIRVDGAMLELWDAPARTSVLSW